MLWRKKTENIRKWISQGKDALLVTGARQIGKTYLIRRVLEEMGQPFIELNLINQPEIIEVLDKSKNANDFLMRLSVVVPKKLEKGRTIIFLDEVQEFKDIITRIKFLVDDGSYKYILSGSLLGVELNDLRSIPTGYLSVIDMYPMDFEEFMVANGVSVAIIDSLRHCYQKLTAVDDFVNRKIFDLFYIYLIVGGMPEAVLEYINTNNIQNVSEIHKKIVRMYRQDFTKYETKNKLQLKEIYDLIPSELSEKNKRFVLNKFSKTARFERIENNFIWLKDAGVAIPIYNVSEPKLPLLLNKKRNLFKLFMSDVGLLTSFYSDSLKIKILNQDRDINNGALFENAVAQELTAHGFPSFYFNSKKYGELDFIIELDGEVVPIEVKSGKYFNEHNAVENILSETNYDIKRIFILANTNVRISEKKIYLPIYMVAFIENTKLINPIIKFDSKGL